MGVLAALLAVAPAGSWPTARAAPPASGAAPGGVRGEAAARLELLAADLANPRGVAQLPDGALLLAEAGDGDHLGDGRHSGRLSLWRDRDGDGRFAPDERRVLLAGALSYNGLAVFNTGRDEVGGLGDVALGPDGVLYFTKDDPFEGYVADGDRRDLGVAALPLAGGAPRTLALRPATVNALAWDPQRGVLYAAESGANRIVALTPDGAVRRVADLAPLAHGQQAVPAGLALDPRDGTLLVALFSGVLYDHGAPGERLAYMPGDAAVVRVDPDSGRQRPVATGLTTAVDVAVDAAGNVYVAELASGRPTARLPRDFDLHAADAPPVAGGYPRHTGRVSVIPADGGPRRVLLAGVDAPTNLAYARLDGEGVLYISAGQGTPGRPIPRWSGAPAGSPRIHGLLYRLRGLP